MNEDRTTHDSTSDDGTVPATAAADGRDQATSAGSAPRSRMLTRRLAATVSALLLLGATAGALLAAEAVPVPEAENVPAPVVDVPAGATTQVCAGEPTLTTGTGMSVDPDLTPEDVEPDTTVQVLSLPREESEAAAATYRPDLTEEAGQDLRRTGDVRALESTADQAGMLTAEPAGGLTALATGATLARTEAGDLRGLVATPCLEPTTTTWLVGGTTETGGSAELVLSNLGQTPATVDVSAWGAVGPLDTARATGVVVPAMSQERLLLEAVVPADPHLALRVSAAGGQVAATVQTHQMDGLVPAGTDTLSPAAVPAREVTIPGVVLDDGAEAVPSSLRVVNPGEETATVSVTLLGADGEVEVPGAETLVVDPGAVYEVSLAGLDAGSYAVALSSDEPVTGGVVLTRQGEAGQLDPDTAPVDRGWTAAAEPVRTGVITVPTGSDTSTLTLTNPGEDPLAVTLRPVGEQVGAPTVVEVAPRSTLSQAVSELGEGVLAVQLTTPGAEDSAIGAGPDGARDDRATGEGATGDGASDDGASDDGATGDGATGPGDEATDGPAGVVAAMVLTAEAADGELISVLPAAPDPHAARTVRVDLR